MARFGTACRDVRLAGPLLTATEATGAATSVR